MHFALRKLTAVINNPVQHPKTGPGPAKLLVGPLNSSDVHPDGRRELREEVEELFHSVPCHVSGVELQPTRGTCGGLEI